MIEDIDYIAYADVDRDGDIDSTDYSIASTERTHTARPEGVLTDNSVDNIFGYSGYIYTPTTKLYCLRLRWYSTDLGRFIERDPLGSVDGMNTYQYVNGAPLGALDPYGLVDWADWNPLGRRYWHNFAEGWRYTRDYWYDKGPVGKVFFWGTHVVVAGFLIYAGGPVVWGALSRAGWLGRAEVGRWGSPGTIFSRRPIPHFHLWHEKLPFLQKFHLPWQGHRWWLALTNNLGRLVPGLSTNGARGVGAAAIAGLGILAWHQVGRRPVGPTRRAPGSGGGVISYANPGSDDENGPSQSEDHIPGSRVVPGSSAPCLGPN